MASMAPSDFGYAHYPYDPVALYQPDFGCDDNDDGAASKQQAHQLAYAVPVTLSAPSDPYHHNGQLGHSLYAPLPFTVGCFTSSPLSDLSSSSTAGAASSPSVASVSRSSVGSSVASPAVAAAAAAAAATAAAAGWPVTTTTSSSSSSSPTSRPALLPLDTAAGQQVQQQQLAAAAAAAAAGTTSTSSTARSSPATASPTSRLSPRTYTPIAPHPAGVRDLLAAAAAASASGPGCPTKRAREEDCAAAAAAAAAAAKRRRASPPPMTAADLSAEDRLLLQLKDDEGLPWKQIAARFESDLGKTFQVPALQMRLKRLRERLRTWSDLDVSALQLAHDFWERSKFDIIADKMADFGARDRWSGKQCARKWCSLLEAQAHQQQQHAQAQQQAHAQQAHQMQMQPPMAGMPYLLHPGSHAPSTGQMAPMPTPTPTPAPTPVPGTVGYLPHIYAFPPTPAIATAAAAGSSLGLGLDLADAAYFPTELIQF